MTRRFSEWLTRKWSNITAPQDARRIYFQHLTAIFNSEPGKFVLNVWLSENYCVQARLIGQNEGDVAYNAGRHDFLHELLQDLHQTETPYRAEPEVTVEADDGSN